MVFFKPASIVGTKSTLFSSFDAFASVMLLYQYSHPPLSVIEIGVIKHL